jgi:hypothetical protein
MMAAGSPLVRSCTPGRHGLARRPAVRRRLAPPASAAAAAPWIGDGDGFEYVSKPGTEEAILIFSKKKKRVSDPWTRQR